ncbi:MAG: hypothetical protein WC343_05640 [Bacilli bacterium]
MPIEMSAEEYEELVQRVNNPDRPLPSGGPPLAERTLSKLLDPDIPDDEKGLKQLWLFSGSSARHVELTNIPTPEAHRKFRRSVTGVLRIATWDAGDYLQQRMAKLVFCDILAGKSIGYTRHSRERDALNESRLTQTVRDDRPAPPRNEGGGFLSFLKRG